MLVEELPCRVEVTFSWFLIPFAAVFWYFLQGKVTEYIGVVWQQSKSIWAGILGPVQLLSFLLLDLRSPLHCLFNDVSLLLQDCLILLFSKLVRVLNFAYEVGLVVDSSCVLVGHIESRLIPSLVQEPWLVGSMADGNPHLVNTTFDLYNNSLIVFIFVHFKRAWGLPHFSLLMDWTIYVVALVHDD